MNKRELTKKIKIENIYVGGSNKVLIQSMCDIKTEKVSLVVEEINKCAKCGADLMRVSVLDEKDALAIKDIKKEISIPLIADIHNDFKLGLMTIESGVDKIRINPGNIGADSDLEKLILKAKEKGVAVRIGVNEGSIQKDLENLDLPLEEKLVKSALIYIEKIEKLGFYNLVISVKSSNSLVTYKTYKLLSEKTSYPLHIGVTESGFDEIGIIRSVSGLSPLLLEGIGDTIRISLSQDPVKEVLTAKRLLHDLGLYDNYPTLITCPTCGRTLVKNLKEISKKVLEYLETRNKFITVAIMGCVINGVGEGKNADIGIAGGNGKFVIFKKGEILKTVDEKEVLENLYSLIDEF